MTFSIKAIIRAWWAPEHRLLCTKSKWRAIVGELERRGAHRHEAGAFLVGHERKGVRHVIGAIYYDELDAKAYASGVCILHGDAFGRLWAECRKRGVTVVADVHTHGGPAQQSQSDKTHPMIARAGHIAIIVPDFASWPIAPHRLGLYEYQGDHAWADRTSPNTPNFFYTGFWS